MKLTDITTDIRVDISFNVPNSVKSAKLIVVSVVLFAWKNFAFFLLVDSYYPGLFCLL